MKEGFITMKKRRARRYILPILGSVIFSYSFFAMSREYAAWIASIPYWEKRVSLFTHIIPKPYVSHAFVIEIQLNQRKEKL